jgi:anti-sigma factor RsiW
VTPAWVTCRELVEFLDDYLAGVLPEAKRDEFNFHLSSCPPCVSYMQSYVEAARLGKAALAATDEPAADVPEDLVQAILAARKKDP